MTRPALAVIDGGQADPVYVCDPVTGEVIPPRDVQHRLSAMADEVAALTKSLGAAHKLNERLKTERDKLKEQQAKEEAGDDAKTIRELVRWHYRLVRGADQSKRKVSMSGLDAQIVLWLIRECEYTPREIALASFAFSKDGWHAEKGKISLQQMCQTRVDMPGKQWQRKVMDPEKVWRWIQIGKRLKGEE